MRILEEIGLTKRESDVYETLLRLGESPIAAVIKETGSHPQVIYRVIDSLAKKQLVTKARRKGRTVVQAESPKRLEKLETERMEKLKSAMPELLALEKPGQETIVRIAKGDEAIRAIRARGIDQLSRGGTHYILGFSGDRFYETMPPDRYAEIENKRVKKKIFKKALSSESQRKLMAKDPHRKLTEFRYLPESFNIPSSTNIFGDLVAILIWSSDPIAITIESKEVAESYRNYFDSLWKIAKP